LLIIVNIIKALPEGGWMKSFELHGIFPAVFNEKVAKPLKIFFA